MFRELDHKKITIKTAPVEDNKNENSSVLSYILLGILFSAGEIRATS